MSNNEFDAAKVARLAAEIAELDRTTEMPNLVKRLKKDHGLKFRKAKSGLTFATMGDVVAKSRQGEDEALRNWGNAARRAVRQAEAA